MTEEAKDTRKLPQADPTAAGAFIAFIGKQMEHDGGFMAHPEPWNITAEEMAAYQDAIQNIYHYAISCLSAVYDGRVPIETVMEATRDKSKEEFSKLSERFPEQIYFMSGGAV